MAIMHLVAYSVYLLLGAICFLSQFHSSLYAGEPSVRINLDKQIYLYGEDAGLLIEWTNTTNSVIEANNLRLGSDGLKIVVIDSQGDTLRFHGLGGGGIGKVRLFPGESMLTTYDLGSWYGDLDTTHYVFRYLRPETYFIHARNRPTQGSEWQRSNELRFTVERPHDEDSLAFNLLNRGRAFVIGRNTRALGIEPLETLVSQYPTSPYSPNAYALLIWAAVKENEILRAEQLWEHAFATYGDHPSMWFAVRQIANTYTKQEKIDLYRRIAIEHPGTNIEKLAKDTVRELESK